MPLNYPTMLNFLLHKLPLNQLFLNHKLHHPLLLLEQLEFRLLVGLLVFYRPLWFHTRLSYFYILLYKSLYQYSTVYK